MIAICCCPMSNGLQFYNPTNGTIVSSVDYKFKPHIISGACSLYTANEVKIRNSS
jgi:hypothetical protein